MRNPKVTGYKKIRTQAAQQKSILMPILIPVLLKTAWVTLTLIILLIVFLLPKTPHLLIDYSYWGKGDYKFYTRCTYIGKHGITNTPGGDLCPLVIWEKDPELKIQAGSS